MGLHRSASDEHRHLLRGLVGGNTREPSPAAQRQHCRIAAASAQRNLRNITEPAETGSPFKSVKPLERCTVLRHRLHSKSCPDEGSVRGSLHDSRAKSYLKDVSETGET